MTNVIKNSYGTIKPEQRNCQEWESTHGGRCRKTRIVHQAEVNYWETKGLLWPRCEDLQTQRLCSFRFENCKDQTKLSELIWELKKEKFD